jgi:ABC-type uncharacterized transport system fused permease/ATPase subunit
MSRLRDLQEYSARLHRLSVLNESIEESHDTEPKKSNG